MSTAATAVASPLGRAPWYRPRSLRGQLLLWLVPLHLLAAVAAGWNFHACYSRLVYTFMDGQMAALAHSHAARSAAEVAKAAPPPVVSDKQLYKWGSFIVQLWSGDGRLLASSRPDIAVPLQTAPGYQDLAPSPATADQGWRVYTASPEPAGGDRLHVQVLQSSRFLSEEVAARALQAGLPIALLLPVLLLVLWLVVGRSSRHLHELAQQVAQRDEGSLQQQIALTRLPEEIAPLVAAFNSLLARLREAFAAQRRFVQDAAHELRTPMAAVSLQLENLRPDVPPGPPQQQLAQLEAGLRRAQHLVEQLLRLSRQEAPASAPPAEPLDLTELLRDSIGQLMVLADRRGIEVGFDGRIAPRLRAAPSDLRSLFDNLLDNALRYTPPGGQVEVRLHAPEDRPVVDIIDSGPGLPPEMRERVFDRFFRMPGASAGGSGLGLAIARAAGARHRLRIELLARDDGAPGLLARIHLGTALIHT
ncbi:HAMP domain-containing protein [Roseateles sp. DAIF2]|uniref:ATP-binding protein n=1 Tax=Roseateles sp. DAIF2 TaxID=2714952 RepID=UPI0018A3336D|nr:ATP-binding protein [Roseateles sp. DAIF2]QPF72237.1 HAMP domain-containing protein [Roseateles sp. DAIF2]